MKIILSSVTIRFPVIEFNGAFLSELATGEHLWTHALDPRLAIELFKMIQDAGHIPFLSTFDGKKDWLYCVSGWNPGMDWYVEDRRAKGDGRLCLVAETGIGLNEQVVCFTVIGEDSKLRPLAERLRCAWGTKIQIHYQENQYSPGWHWLTIHDCQATKDQAVRQFLKLARLEGAEIVAFGDAENDLGLFAVANHSVAVANALPSVRERADEVIGANTEDSVVLWLEKDWHYRKNVLT